MQNGPAREGRAVACQHPADSDAHSTIAARLQRLTRLGLAPTRAALLATMVFGEVAA